MRSRAGVAFLLAFFALQLMPAALTAAPPAARDLEIRVTARVSGKFVSPAGKEPPGFDVELLRRFAAWYKVRTGKEARLAFSYAATVPALLEVMQQGGADLGMGGVTATAERAKVVDFSLPTLPVRSVLVAPPGLLDPTQWRQRVAGKRLGATVGSTNAAQVDRIAAANGKVVVNTTFETNEAVFAALASKPRTLDAAVVDLPQYWTQGKQQGLVLVDSVGEPEHMAFVLRKGSPLKAQIDPFLDAYTHSSEYFQLIRRYFGQDAEEMVRLSRQQR